MRLSLGDPPDTVVSAEDRDDRIIRERRFRMGGNIDIADIDVGSGDSVSDSVEAPEKELELTKHSAMYSTHSAHHQERIQVLFNAMGVSNPRLRATS